MRVHQRIRRQRLQGEQIDLDFPRRGRPSKFRRLERAGQMRLSLERGRETKAPIAETKAAKDEALGAALDYLFPVGPLTEIELAAEFERLFPIEA